ncbi:MAG: hypothetical protein JNM14_14615 [Ferruginibacter sp.]|nr:hypothetical protein [Ferruginibacter sp.]
MKSHFELSDELFEVQFQNGKLDPALFDHEAHLRLAWIHINRYGEAKAIENITNQLYAYVVSLGAADKYNKTLTVAAIKAVSHFISRSDAGNFPEFILEFPRLKYNFKELMAFHYRMDIYNSETAKRHYLEPDLIPFT